MVQNAGKSNDQSNICRTEGNQFYAQKIFYDALLKYNDSLLAAESGTSNLGLAYANRSAVYIEMRMFERCLRNIELAKQNNYPEKDFEILTKRREKCLELSKHQKDDLKSADVKDLFKLSYPSNPRLSYVADCVDLKVDKKFGRHIVANRNLKAGDIVAIEEPFATVVHEKTVNQRCAGCFVDNQLDLIPCNRCQKAMFCSLECEKSAFDKFHQFECPMMELILSPIMTATMRLAVRTLFTSLALFGGSFEELDKFMKENFESRTVFDIQDCSDPKETLLAVNSLIANHKLEVNETFFEELFQSSAELKSMWSSHADFIRSFLKKQTQIGTMNYHEIHGWPLKKGGLRDEEFDELKGLAYKTGVTSWGSGSYPFISMLNHSCAPNVSRVFVGNKNVVFVQRSIKKGDQLFDNYGYDFTNVPRDHRQKELYKQFKFKCGCEACTENWVLLPSLKVLDKSCLNKAKKACRELNLAGLNQKKAKDKFKELCQSIESSHKNFPSVEVCSMINSATAYLEIMMKPIVQFP